MYLIRSWSDHTQQRIDVDPHMSSICRRQEERRREGAKGRGRHVHERLAVAFIRKSLS